MRTAGRMSVSFVSILAAAAFLSGSAVASPQRPFTDQAFASAQDAGKPVLIEIHADWCPTCKAQLPILDRLSAQPRYASIVRFRVDYDSQKSAVRRFKATTQSTLVLYKGRDEVARSVGETREDRIRAMLDQAL